MIDTVSRRELTRGARDFSIVFVCASLALMLFSHFDGLSGSADVLGLAAAVLGFKIGGSPLPVMLSTGLDWTALTVQIIPLTALFSGLIALNLGIARRLTRTYARRRVFRLPV